MKKELIKPIPKHILKAIKKKDLADYAKQDGIRRFYSYLTKNDGELVKVTVAVRNRYGKWFCKQVAVHGLDSQICFAKDINFYYISGYVVGWWEEGFYKNCKWWEGDGWCTFDDAAFNPYAPVINPEFALKFKKYKYSAVDKYTYCDIEKYLRLYEKYPQMEYLTKLGLSCVATRKMILKSCQKNKKFRKWLCLNAQKIAENHYYVCTILTAYKKSLDFDSVQALETIKKQLRHKDNYKEIKKEFYSELPKLIAYIANHGTSLSCYDDYFRACKNLGLDIKDTKHRYPIDFKFWHDRRIEEYRIKVEMERQEKRKAFAEDFSKVVMKFLPLERNRKEPFVVIIAKTPTELTKEGQTLHHCVGSGYYDQKIARQESLIFFVRRVNDIQTPYVTIEYSIKNKTILQCYGDNNSRPEDTTLDFINNKWLPYANRKIHKLVA